MYSNNEPIDAIKQVELLFQDQGERIDDTLELNMCNLIFDDFVWNPKLEEDALMHILHDDQLMFQVHSYIQQEVNDRISGQPINPGTGYKMVPKMFDKHFNGHKMNFTYAERIAPQLDKAIEHLLDYGSDVVITMRQVSDCGFINIKEYIPNVMYYHPIIRANKVDMVCSMSKADYFGDFIIELMIAMRMQMWFAHKLEIPNLGKLMFSVNILYADIEKLDNRTE